LKTGREKGVIVYPVYSRRSGGLSVGINLFPDKKSFSFDCPYCEIYSFPKGMEFIYLLTKSMIDVRNDKKAMIESGGNERRQNEALRYLRGEMMESRAESG
jgi:wyosine [tRNA(Phe)-imidazoG37] synthetase (radical SAM superfamily)